MVRRQRLEVRGRLTSMKRAQLPDCFDNKIMHATARIGKTTLMASDGQCEGNQDFEGFALSITVPNETEA